MASSSSRSDPLASVFDASPINDYVKTQVKKRKTEIVALEAELDGLRASKRSASISEHGDLVRTIHIHHDKGIAAWKSLQALNCRIVRVHEPRRPKLTFPDNTKDFELEDNRRPSIKADLDAWCQLIESTDIGMAIYGRSLGIADGVLDWSMIFPRWFRQADDVMTRQAGYGLETMQLFTVRVHAQLQELPYSNLNRIVISSPHELGNNNFSHLRTTRETSDLNDVIVIGTAYLDKVVASAEGWIAYELDGRSSCVTIYVCSPQYDAIQGKDWLLANFTPLIEGSYGSSQGWSYNCEALFNVSSEGSFTNWSGPLAAHVLHILADPATSRPLWSLSSGLADNRHVQTKSVVALQIRHLGMIVEGHHRLYELYEAIKEGNIVPGFHTAEDHVSGKEMSRDILVITD